MKWVFTLESDPGREIWRFTSQSLSPRSVAYRLFKGIGVDLEAGDTVDTDDVDGYPVDVMFEDYTPKQGPNAGNASVRVRTVRLRDGETYQHPDERPF